VETFDLAVPATAFHWLDPAVAYRETARTLKLGGAIAMFWNVHVQSDASGDSFEAAQEVYEREAPEIAGAEDYKGLPRPDEVPDRAGEIGGSGLFRGGDYPQIPVGRVVRRRGLPARLDTPTRATEA
jgi:hypothetical protein